MDYGCFVKIEDSIEGLIHNSELDWTKQEYKAKQSSFSFSEDQI